MKTLNEFETMMVSGGSDKSSLYTDEAYGDTGPGPGVSPGCIAGTIGVAGTVVSAINNPSPDNIAKAIGTIGVYIANGCWDQVALTYGNSQVQLGEASKF